MKVKETYANLTERADKIALREGQGLRMLHDNFDPDWKRGDEPHGTMTFTNEPAPVILEEPVRDFAAEIDKIKATLADHEARLKKDVGGHIR